VTAKRRKRRIYPSTNLTLEELDKQLDAYSDRISTQLRTLNLGILGIVWLFLVKQHDVEKIAIKIPEKGLICIALGCIFVLCLDLLQYVFAERTVDEAFERAERSASKTAAYHPDTFNYRAQLWCYALKRIITGINAAALVVLVGRVLF
jgi:hypothetical protein